jgi:hypothetical protein
VKTNAPISASVVAIWRSKRWSSGGTSLRLLQGSFSDGFPGHRDGLIKNLFGHSKPEIPPELVHEGAGFRGSALSIQSPEKPDGPNASQTQVLTNLSRPLLISDEEHGGLLPCLNERLGFAFAQLAPEQSNVCPIRSIAPGKEAPLKESIQPVSKLSFLVHFTLDRPRNVNYVEKDGQLPSEAEVHEAYQWGAIDDGDPHYFSLRA